MNDKPVAIPGAPAPKKKGLPPAQCPFCDGTAQVVPLNGEGAGFLVGCSVCGAMGPCASTEEDAALNWNMRAKDPAHLADKHRTNPLAQQCGAQLIALAEACYSNKFGPMQAFLLTLVEPGKVMRLAIHAHNIDARGALSLAQHTVAQLEQQSQKSAGGIIIPRH